MRYKSSFGVVASLQANVPLLILNEMGYCTKSFFICNHWVKLKNLIMQHDDDKHKS